jgi:hypothetical protein
VAPVTCIQNTPRQKSVRISGAPSSWPAASLEGFERGFHELAARHIDIVLAAGPEIALKSALATAGALPIVMIAIDYDPLALG